MVILGSPLFARKFDWEPTGKIRLTTPLRKQHDTLIRSSSLWALKGRRRSPNADRSFQWAASGDSAAGYDTP
jgi:hypothetical protein